MINFGTRPLLKLNLDESVSWFWMDWGVRRNEITLGNYHSTSIYVFLWALSFSWSVIKLKVHMIWFDEALASLGLNLNTVRRFAILMKMRHLHGPFDAIENIFSWWKFLAKLMASYIFFGQDCHLFPWKKLEILK